LPKYLIIMVKLPRPGRVKTRLGRGIGQVTAAWWYRHQVARLLRNLTDPRWQIVLAVAPDFEAMHARVWPAHIPRIPQGRGNLGTRMAHALTSFPAGDTVLIGSDIPGVARDHIARAFKALGSAPAVFGPAFDGGFWLVGFRNGRVPLGAFKGVRWSSAHALSDSIASLGGVTVALIDALADVDTAADLTRKT